LKEGTQVEKTGADISRRSSPQIYANALPPSLSLSVQTLLHLLYMEKYRFRAWAPSPKSVSPEQSWSPAFSLFFFLPNFRNLAREKKEKEGANFQRYKGYLWGNFCAPVLTLLGNFF
jgi:hypothetical protein